MDEELQKALALVLQTALDAKDFLIAELPEVIQQLLLWKFWYYSIRFAVGALFALGIMYAAYRISRYILALIKKRGPDEFFWFMPLIIVTIVASVIPAHFLNLIWLQIWIAPKVYLIEYAASLAK